MRHTILFMAANPVETDRLEIDREEQSIRVELERSMYRERFELVTRWAVQALDFLRAPRKLKPTLIHFSGHGGRSAPDDRGGLYLQGQDGRAQYVTSEALKDAFSAADVPIKVIVLNACYSEQQADALLSCVDCVIGMKDSISDEAARSFATGFYGAIGDGQSIELAFRQGCAAIHLEALHHQDRPQLRTRTGIFAKNLILA